MTVVKLKKKRRQRGDLVPIDQKSGPGRFFSKMLREIESDLGGRSRLSRIQLELAEAFCGSAVALRYQTHQILLGDVTEVDLSSYSTLGSTMLRIGSRLGFERRAKDVTPTLSDLLSEDQAEQRNRLAEDEAQ
jgi:hypothetical protein